MRTPHVLNGRTMELGDACDVAPDAYAPGSAVGLMSDVAWYMSRRDDQRSVRFGAARDWDRDEAGNRG